MADSFKYSDAPASYTTKSRQTEDRYGVYSVVEVEVRDKDGNLKSRSVQHNARTAVGADFWAAQLFGTAASTTPAKYVALTTDSAAVNSSDTTLASELTTNGLGRALATVSHSAGTSSVLVSNVFTYSGSSPITINKMALFTDATTGVMVLESLLAASATLNASGDTLTVNWTVNF